MPEHSHVSHDWWLKLARPRTWILFLLAYFLLHMGMRLLLSDTLQLDDAEQLIQSQGWRLNYGNFQPPFYTWVLWALWQVVDPSLGALYLIRYLIIGLTFWLWYRVSCLLFDDPRWVVASVTSWLLLVEFAWKLHQGSTHTTLLTLALVMSLHAIVLILRSPRLRHYLYLGLAVGLGMLAKYSYAGFLVPMLLAGLVAPDSRERLLRRPMFYALGMAVLVMLPALFSLFAPDIPLDERLQGQTNHHLGGLFAGDASLLIDFTKGALAFLAPMWLVYVLIFRVPFGPGADLLQDRSAVGTASPSRSHSFSPGRDLLQDKAAVGAASPPRSHSFGPGTDLLQDTVAVGAASPPRIDIDSARGRASHGGLSPRVAPPPRSQGLRPQEGPPTEVGAEAASVGGPLWERRPRREFSFGRGTGLPQDRNSPGSSSVGAASPPRSPSFGPGAGSLLDRFHLVVLVLIVAVSLFVGIDHLKSRWLHPFLTLVPFWWLLHASAHPVRRHAWVALKWVTVALIVLVIVARLWQLLATPYIGKKPSRVTWPVVEALQQLPPEVLQSPRLKITDPYLAAHVRLLTHRPVEVSAFQRGDAGAVWLWGGLTRTRPADISAGHGQVHWVHAQRGRASYWVAYATSDG